MVESVPGSRRTFAGVALELAASPDSYVYKQDSGVLHVPSCPHEPTRRIEPWPEERVVEAWHAAPDLPIADVTEPRFCTTCVARWVHPETEEPHSAARIGKVAAAASQVLNHLFGDGRSVIDPEAEIWSAENAERLRAAIEDSPDTSDASTWEKLRSQLEDQPRAVVLLAAELLYLRSVPLLNVTAATKLERLRRVLSWLPDQPSVPDSMEQGLRVGGTFNGGQGFNTQLWQQIVWLATFVTRWQTLSAERRAELRSDPWLFREFLADADRDLPSMRNAFAFLVFPDVFEETINDGHKVAIRREFQHVIGGASGEDGEALDRDLLAIRQAIEAQTGERISWYLSPWDGWRPSPSVTGDRAWAVRPARHEGRALVEEWLATGYVSLTAAHLGEVPPGAELAVVRSAVSAGYDHQDYAQQHELANDYFAFLSRMEVGDVVVARLDDDAWLGRISGDASYSPDAPRLRRDVEWEPERHSVAGLPAPLPSLLSRTGTVLDLTEGRGVLDALLAIPTASHDDDAAPDLVALPTEVTLPRATPQLAARLHMPLTWLDDVITTLDERRQIILFGPPGTGKTYSAREIAKHVAGDGVTIVQFHPSYAYEDFFEGFRPRDDGDGRLSFQLREGPLRQIARAAMSDPTSPWVLIIDEINRGNIAKIFGELYFLLEYRDSSISLQYSSDKPFALPKNLFIIGTMNTADRSIAMVDAAIRRRFAFLELHPDSEPVDGLLERWLEANLKSGERAALLRSLNAELGQEHRDFQIGPSYLMRRGAESDVGLERIWRYDILPLLEEHFYGQLSPAEVAARFGLAAVRRRALPTPDMTVVLDEVEVDDGVSHPGTPAAPSSD